MTDKTTQAPPVATFSGRAQGFAEYHDLNARTRNFMASEAAHADATIAYLIAALRDCIDTWMKDELDPIVMTAACEHGQAVLKRATDTTGD